MKFRGGNSASELEGEKKPTIAEASREAQQGKNPGSGTWARLKKK